MNTLCTTFLPSSMIHIPLKRKGSFNSISFTLFILYMGIRLKKSAITSKTNFIVNSPIRSKLVSANAFNLDKSNICRLTQLSFKESAESNWRSPIYGIKVTKYTEFNQMKNGLPSTKLREPKKPIIHKSMYRYDSISHNYL